MLSKDRLGERIRGIRLARGMTLKEVAVNAGLSAPHICEIEQGKTSPTFGALAKIAAALEKPVAYFLEDEVLPEVSVVRDGEKVALPEVDGARGVAIAATPLTQGVTSGHLRVRRLVLEPRHRTAICRHHGQEGGVLLKGRIEARIGDQVRTLQRGDVAFFAAERVHQLCNPGPERAELLWIQLDTMTD